MPQCAQNRSGQDLALCKCWRILWWPPAKVWMWFVPNKTQVESSLPSAAVSEGS